MKAPDKISATLIEEERLKGTRLSVTFRWVLILMAATLLGFQYFFGHTDISLNAVSLLMVYFFTNLVFWFAAIRNYNPRYLGFLGGTIDLAIVSYHIYGMTALFDPTSATAAATTFLIPIIFLIYTIRLDRALMYYLITISLIGFNLVYFNQYIQTPEPFSSNISLSPISHIFKSVYIAFIGWLCIYMQHSLFRFIQKQYAEAKMKAELDAEVKLEQQKSRFALDMVEKEKALNKKLEKTVEERTARLTEANTQLLKLQKENLQSQFEVLKQQVNPHFLFNSLNVLTSLIKVDPDLAESFTEKLSKVYRYVLENKEKDLITLATELDFIRSYIFLLDIRFSGKVFVEIDIDEKYHETLVIPMVLQLLVENAVKHNTFSKKNPLHISLTVDSNNHLTVMNNLQNRKTQMSSTGVGLVNISKRYSLLTGNQPVFDITDTEFTARIPLIEQANNRSEIRI